MVIVHGVGLSFGLLVFILTIAAIVPLDDEKNNLKLPNG